MLKVLLIRHAATKQNKKDIFMGREDFPIDPNVDFEKLENLRQALEGIDYTHIYASPLVRCKQTADLLFPNAEITFDSRLLEKDLGDWVNHDKQAIRDTYPQYFDADGKMNISLTPPNGESFDEFCARIKDFINEMLLHHDGKTLAVITHGGVIAVITRYLCCPKEEREVCLSTKSISHLDHFLITVNSPLK